MLKSQLEEIDELEKANERRKYSQAINKLKNCYRPKSLCIKG